MEVASRSAVTLTDFGYRGIAGGIAVTYRMGGAKMYRCSGRDVGGRDQRLRFVLPLFFPR